MIGRKKRTYKRRTSRLDEEPAISAWHLGTDTKKTIFVIILFTVSLLGLVSLFNGAGTLGQGIKAGLGRLFGWMDWMALVLLLVLDYMIIMENRARFRRINYLGLILILISLTGLLDFAIHEQSLTDIGQSQAGGGYLGYGIGRNLDSLTGTVGSMIILIGLLASGLIIVFNTSIAQLREILAGHKSEDWLDESSVGTEQLADVAAAEATPLSALLDEREAALTIVEEIENKEEKEILTEHKRVYKPVKRIEIPIDLLSNATTMPTSGDIKVNGQRIQKTLETFGIEVTMGDVNVGPTVTQYTLKPADGVKLAQITSLQNDIALALAAHPIRIEAPIPGKSLIGIEVPNQKVSMVRLREIISSEAFTTRKSNLMVALGKDVTGKSVMADLGKMPHLLIAGATGSGKSVAINCMITSLLWQNSPSDLKFIMVDPKRVELSTYNDIPHLLCPVITDTKATINALRWIVGEMDERYKLLAAAGKKNIESYNQALLLNKLHYTVVVIDELADLMAVAAKEVEAAIIRLAQMARAVGIHLVLATQRPSVNVITGLIKANITSRVAFSVASSADSRTILDMSGAEKLLGNGDMLFTSAELSKPRRLQGAFISEKEVQAVADYLREHGKPDYNMQITESLTRASGMIGGIDADEEDLATATDVVVKSGRASATLLQTRMRIGYAKAARLLDLLEERGIVGPNQGSKAREVLVTAEDLNNRLESSGDRYQTDDEIEVIDEEETDEPAEEVEPTEEPESLDDLETEEDVDQSSESPFRPWESDRR